MPRTKILKDKRVYDGKHFAVIERRYLGTKGKPEVWEMVKRKTYGEIVGVVPITENKELILTKTYRIPLKSYVIELCAGLMDKKGESKIEVARRELLEETGYSAKRFRLITRGPYNAGLSTDRMNIFLAEGAKKVEKPHTENSEDIIVIKVPLARVYHLLTHPPKNTMIDGKIFGMLYLLEKMGYPL